MIREDGAFGERRSGQRASRRGRMKKANISGYKAERESEEKSKKKNNGAGQTA
jgi:hypothetical protein